MRELLSMGTEVRITNRIEAQLRELLKALNPSIKFTEESLKEAIDNHLGGSDLMYYGSWVHYPWSNHLVHLLGAEEFALVRTDRNRNKITREEQAELATKKIGVIGLSVGQSVSLTMAMERSFGEIRLADFDTLDLSNLNRIRTGVRHLGMNKAVITAREIAEIDPYLNVVCFTDGLTQANMEAFFTGGGKLDILVEECDSVDIKILARQQAKALRIPVVMDMSDRGCLDVERFDLEPDRPIMHGWIDHLDLEAAKRPMSAEEKVPYMLPITGVETLSPRMKASVIELGQTISTWPQLATSVVLGGALAGDAVRRIALDQFHASGRWFVDLEEQVADPPGPAEPEPSRPAPFKLTTAMMEQLNRELGPAPDGALSLDQQTIEQLVQAGGMAPSAGNMQPWKFLWHCDRLILFHDASRSFSRFDPDHRIANIALGACIENIVLQSQAIGLETATKIFGGPSSKAVASFSFHGKSQHEREPHSPIHYAKLIGLRCTNRKVTCHKPIEKEVEDQLIAAANSLPNTHGWVYSSPGELAQIASICGRAERLRVLNRTAHQEFFNHELRWSREEAFRTKDGLDIATMEISPKDIAGLQVVSDPRTRECLTEWSAGRNLEEMAGVAIRNSSAVLLITIDVDDVPGQLAGGRAAERAWLAASSFGLSVHPISAPIFLTHILRYKLKELGVEEEEELTAIKAQMSQVFHLSPGEVPLFLMRLSEAGSPSVRSCRLDVGQLFTNLNLS